MSRKRKADDNVTPSTAKKSRIDVTKNPRGLVTGRAWCFLNAPIQGLGQIKELADKYILLKDNVVRNIDQVALAALEGPRDQAARKSSCR